MDQLLYVWFQLHEELVLSVPLSPKNCWPWLELKIVTHLLVVLLVLLAILLRLHMLLLLRHTLIWHLICGKTCHLRRPHTLSLRIIFPKATKSPRMSGGMYNFICVINIWAIYVKYQIKWQKTLFWVIYSNQKLICIRFISKYI